MERLERIVLLHRLLSANRIGLSTERLMDEAQCSRATLYRDLAFLRDSLGAPLDHQGDPNRFWSYARDEAVAFQLPGLWLSADELYALLLAQQVMSSSGAGLLEDALGKVQPRINRLLGDKARELGRLRVIRSAPRKVDEAVFRAVAQSVLERRQLKFRYKARSTSTEQVTERRVHPQRLTHYRDNWYLDALDETRAGLRSFALDRVQSPQVLFEETARDIDPAELDAQVGAGYGIFSGAIRDTATIRFSPHAARWVSEERWHAQQQGRFMSDGSYELKVPYTNPRELLMDVLRYGGDARVVGPVALREQMRTMLALAMSGYNS